MSKGARGTKRVCKSCGGRFYDLNRDPIVCPLCGATYVTESAVPEEPPPVVEQASAASEVEPVADVAATATATATATADADGPELVSLDDAKAEEEEAVDALEDDEDLADLDDDDSEIPADDADDAFLEDDDEADPDVSGIIGGAPLKPAEES